MAKKQFVKIDCPYCKRRTKALRKRLVTDTGEELRDRCRSCEHHFPAGMFKPGWREDGQPDPERSEGSGCPRREHDMLMGLSEEAHGQLTQENQEKVAVELALLATLVQKEADRSDMFEVEGVIVTRIENSDSTKTGVALQGVAIGNKTMAAVHQHYSHLRFITWGCHTYGGLTDGHYDLTAAGMLADAAMRVERGY